MQEHATLQEWLDKLAGALAAGTLVTVVFSKPMAGGELKGVEVRPIMVKRQLKLSFTYHYKTRDIVKNFELAESQRLAAALLKKEFGAARLHTVAEDWLVLVEKGSFSLKRQAPTVTEAPSLSHDRAKQRVVESKGQVYLHALGITDAQGQVRAAAQDKFRQINKYIEIVDGLLKTLPAGEKLRVVDMGCGKGYLTFALYDHVANTLGRAVEMVGVEYRQELVALCSEVARQARFDGLKFVQGSIADYDCTGVNVVIALHACDTATDDALAKGVGAGAELIIVAPCCHKQIRREMTVTAAHPLHFLLQHGTYVERMAEMVTDGIRAQVLEMAGYATKLFEFISDAHTPKNVMIVATKGAALNAGQQEKLAGEIAAAKAQFGTKRHYLEGLLGGGK